MRPGEHGTGLGEVVLARGGSPFVLTHRGSDSIVMPHVRNHIVMPVTYDDEHLFNVDLLVT